MDLVGLTVRRWVIGRDRFASAFSRQARRWEGIVIHFARACTALAVQQIVVLQTCKQLSSSFPLTLFRVLFQLYSIGFYVHLPDLITKYRYMKPGCDRIALELCPKNLLFHSCCEQQFSHFSSNELPCSCLQAKFRSQTELTWLIACRGVAGSNQLFPNNSSRFR